MKEYPSIPKDVNKDLSFYVFDKIDGSNIRAEWTKKSGFSKFGTRHLLLDPNDSENILAKSVPLIQQYEEQVRPIFKELQLEKATLFFEFCGPNSFAGNHCETDEFSVVLLDVDGFKKGILMPDDFLDYFGHLKIPTLLHHGKVNQEIVNWVKQSLLDGMTFEGVVAKARNPKKTLQPVMFKIKSQAWLDKLHNFCGDDAELFKRLA